MESPQMRLDYIICFPLHPFIHLLSMSSSSNPREFFYLRLPEHEWAAAEEKLWEMERQVPEPAGGNIPTGACVARWGHPLCHWGKLHR